MSDKITIKLVGPEQRKRAYEAILRAPAGYVVTVSEPTRTLDQNAKLWAMIADCQRQIPDMRAMDSNDIKLRFMDALGVEMRYIQKLDSAGYFPVGHRSSKLSKSQFAALIELIYVHGAAHGVRWSEPDPLKYAA
jgi:predicted NUDIX family NTP pyrophosphohydrolase